MASFNFDWHANGEEMPYWVNMSAQKINLDSPMLLAAARAMAPSVLRIGGSEGDVLCYDVSEPERMPFLHTLVPHNTVYTQMLFVR